MAAIDGARTDDTETIALETQEKLFIDVSRRPQSEGGGDTSVVRTVSGVSQLTQLAQLEACLQPPAHTQVWGLVHLSHLDCVSRDVTVQCSSVVSPIVTVCHWRLPGLTSRGWQVALATSLAGPHSGFLLIHVVRFVHGPTQQMVGDNCVSTSQSSSHLDDSNVFPACKA